MIWMPHRVQPRFIWTAIFAGVLIFTNHLQAHGGSASPSVSGPGTVTGSASGVAVAAAAPMGSGGAHLSGGERSSGPVEAGRIYQPAVAANGLREAPTQTRFVERGEGGNQSVGRGVENGAYGGEVNAGLGAEAGRTAARPGNVWTDPSGAGQQRRYYSSSTQNYSRQSAYRHRSRSNSPYISRYYGGYYPIYVDVPIYGDYEGGGAVINSGYDGGPEVVPDPGSGVGPVIAPSTITVSPDGNPQPTAGVANNPDAANGASNAGPDAAQAGSGSPNPALGPDSLVEAVQTELTRRGYFQGKIDAMFHPDTEAAVRHFQQDNYLAPTGHLNEATLHALNLD